MGFRRDAEGQLGISGFQTNSERDILDGNAPSLTPTRSPNPEEQNRKRRCDCDGGSSGVQAKSDKSLVDIGEN